MLITISPSKTLDYRSALPALALPLTQPILLDHSQQLIQHCQQLSVDDISKLMHISEKLALLNHDRFLNWHRPFTADNARPALFAFKGDVYDGLHAADFSAEDCQFAQQHLRMLSGLYGILRPLDLMQPYRLEMGCKLQNVRGDNLYQFWGDILTEQLNQQLQQQAEPLLVNLASDEYFKAINPKKLHGKLLKITFLDEKQGQYKIISFYAKRARGLMSRFIIKHQLTEAEALKAFDLAGYVYDSAQSTAAEYVFTRSEATCLALKAL